MPDEELISGLEVPSGNDKKEEEADTTDIVIHYEGTGADSTEKSIDLTIGKGRSLALIGKPDMAGFSFRLPISNLEKIGVSMIFLDPKSVLNPDKPVIDHICDIVMIHQHASRKVATEKAWEILKNVGISESRADNYPHEFSDEMKQRIVVAAALAHHPILIIANETASDLDMTLKKQILGIVKDNIAGTDTSLLLIMQESSLADEICDDKVFL